MSQSKTLKPRKYLLISWKYENLLLILLKKIHNLHKKKKRKTITKCWYRSREINLPYENLSIYKWFLVSIYIYFFKSQNQNICSYKAKVVRASKRVKPSRVLKVQTSCLFLFQTWVELDLITKQNCMFKLSSFYYWISSSIFKS